MLFGKAVKKLSLKAFRMYLDKGIYEEYGLHRISTCDAFCSF